MLCRSAPHSLRSMQAGLLARNRESFFFSFLLSWGGESLGGILSNYLNCLLLKPMNFTGSEFFLGQLCIHLHIKWGVSP